MAIEKNSHLFKKVIFLGLLFTKQYRNGRGEKRNDNQNYGQDSPLWVGVLNEDRNRFIIYALYVFRKMKHVYMFYNVL